MDSKKIGSLIYQLRKDKSMTQKQIADKLNISDKAISKWERGQGLPDISLLGELSKVLDISVEQLLSGEITLNESVGGNMNKLKFYVCEQCGNLITSTGNPTISCCGKILDPAIAKKAEDSHKLKVEPVEDELYVTTEHEMRKDHYISFVAYVKGDRALIVKQYPEWDMQFRFHKLGHGKLYFYCTNHGLFYQII